MRSDDETSAFEREWRARFERFGRAHADDAGVAGWSKAGLDARVRRFMTLWPKTARAGQRWFDAGCGAGTYTRLLHETGAQAFGLDYSLPALQRARAANPLIAFVVGDVGRLPLASASVDGVLCFGVTQAMSSSERVVRELVRVTKPGGEIWIDGLNHWAVTSLAARSYRRLRGKRHKHLRYERPASLCRTLHEAGAASVELHWLPLAPSRTPRLQRLLESSLATKAMRALYPCALLTSHSFIVRGTVSAV